MTTPRPSPDTAPIPAGSTGPSPDPASRAATPHARTDPGGSTTTGWGGRAFGVACLIAACVVGLAELVGRPDPVAMPTTPAWLTVLAALATGILTLWPSRPAARMRLGLVALGTTCMAAGSVLAVPHTVLMLLVWAANLITGGEGSFDVQPAWWATTAHLATVAATLAAAVWLLAHWRLWRGCCPRCGRTTAQPPPPGHRTTRALPWLAALAVLGALPYGLLKTAWSLGSRVGLVGHAFDDVSFASPGFGDTAVLTGLSVAVCVVMGARVSRPPVRIAASAVGAIGSVMLLPVGAFALVLLGPVAAGQASIDDSEIAPWAFLLVYVSFLVWGVALATLTVMYWRATAAVCGRHRPGAAHGIGGTVPDDTARHARSPQDGQPGSVFWARFARTLAGAPTAGNLRALRGGRSSLASPPTNPQNPGGARPTPTR